MEQERTRDIKLGEHMYTVVAQRHSYLQRALGPRFSSLADMSASDTSQIAGAATKGYHSLLSVFIPDLMPLYEWEGFPTEEAFSTDDWHKELDHAPSIDQMVIAAEAVAEVNRLDLVKHIKELVGPNFLRALRAKAEVELTKWLAETGDSSSASSPPSNGASAPTNGSTIAPTSAPSGDGHTPASSTT